jgi:hypothetical protein
MYAVVNQTLGTLELWSEYCWIWITSLFLIKKTLYVLGYSSRRPACASLCVRMCVRNRRIDVDS